MTNRPLRAAPDPDDFSDLHAKLDGSSPKAANSGRWEPQEDGPGSSIEGRVAAAEEIETKWGKKLVLTLDTSAGQREVRAFHAALRTRLDDQPPAKGTRIVIRYDGKGKTAADHDLFLYSVAVDQTLAIKQGEDWIKVFNAATPSQQSSARTTKRQRRVPRPSNPSDLPF